MTAEILDLFVNNPDVFMEISFGFKELGTKFALEILFIFVNSFHVSQ